MSDLDPITELQGRLADLEARLTYVRSGKAPPQPVDLLSWRADTGVLADQSRSVMRTLRENWQGLSEAIRNWAIRFEARLGR